MLLRAALATCQPAVAATCESVGINADAVTLLDAITALSIRRRSLELTDPEAASAIEAALKPLKDLHAAAASPHELGDAPISPAKWDVMITDITDLDLDEIYTTLSIARLARIEAEQALKSDASVGGIFFGHAHRLFVPLTVQARHILHVAFLVDTGAPSTYLRKETLEHLGFVENVPQSAKVRIAGITLQANISHGHFDNVDVLGQDFLRAARALLEVNYCDLTVTLKAAPNA